VNLFFDRIIHSIVAGYQKELGTVYEASPGKNPLIAKIFKR